MTPIEAKEDITSQPIVDVVGLAASAIACELRGHPEHRSVIVDGVASILEQEGVAVIDAETAFQETSEQSNSVISDDVLRAIQRARVIAGRNAQHRRRLSTGARNARLERDLKLITRRAEKGSLS